MYDLPTVEKYACRPLEASERRFEPVEEEGKVEDGRDKVDFGVTEATGSMLMRLVNIFQSFALFSEIRCQVLFTMQ